MACENTEDSFPHKDLLAATKAYAQALPSDQGELAIAPRYKLIIITCMDARIDVFKIFGLRPGDAHVIRNAGGNARDAVRSVIVSQQMLGTYKIYVMKHTDCGMEGLKNKTVSKKISENLGVSGGHIDFQGFNDVYQAVRDDVSFLEGNELIISSYVWGWVYDVKTGKSENVVGPNTSC